MIQKEKDSISRHPLSEITSSLIAHVKKNKALILYLMTKEIEGIAEEYKYNELVYLNSPIINPVTNFAYGEILGTFACSPDDSNYYFRIDSFPIVDPRSPYYFDPVSLEIDTETEDIMFIIEPYACQPFNQEEGVSMSFFQDEYEPHPRWHCYRSYDEIETDNSLPPFEINSPLSDQDLTRLFIRSASLGNLPGFEYRKYQDNYFSSAHFNKIAPYAEEFGKS